MFSPEVSLAVQDALRICIFICAWKYSFKNELRYSVILIPPGIASTVDSRYNNICGLLFYVLKKFCAAEQFSNLLHKDFALTTYFSKTIFLWAIVIARTDCILSGAFSSSLCTFNIYWLIWPNNVAVSKWLHFCALIVPNHGTLYRTYSLRWYACAVNFWHHYCLTVFDSTKLLQNCFFHIVNFQQRNFSPVTSLIHCLL